ncbi:methylated-DNA-[protein]-cysteine S-methyltransferase [Propionibacterium sp. oral taxon 192 str. F0372]|uniref:methylated-DNA--[protein]-cysteine S-methyltransferase n=1 Tax=Propionibacterium sp. oral taxon 192 TaxID=671222 RepID=UPI000353925F|nr:methylated-DNA--[protein]-cysteine S-methyltransferase [Propionibacterium sp. oral taxon 192]EPH06812.1 methylated-DNA-[protein]-cysteine S-methyltransferase [Propionibacterium sp. oral taxon 192 str. F0372]
MSYRIIDSPIGPLTLVVDGNEVIALHTAAQVCPVSPQLLGERDDSVAQDAVDQLAEYFAGTRTSFDLRLSPRGTDFQHRVWQAIARVAYGHTASYAEIARVLGIDGSARAVGAAIGRNPLLIIVPCHRIIGSDGSLTGYAGGLDRKRWLLAHERQEKP